MNSAQGVPDKMGQLLVVEDSLWCWCIPGSIMKQILKLFVIEIIEIDSERESTRLAFGCQRELLMTHDWLSC